MSLYCPVDEGSCDWYWILRDELAPLATKRSRKCCSCGERIAVGNPARTVKRHRPATDWEECRGFGDEIALAPWYLCETCGDLADSVHELGFCFNLGENIKAQIAEYRAENGR
jgi:hypothetical protein